MVGSWDYARWSPKTFVDRHVAAQVRGSRLENFQQMTLGWWPVMTGTSSSYGYMRDDVEYFGAKISGYGCGFSLIPNYCRGRVLSYAALSQLTVLGWYERFRRSGMFRPELLQGFCEQGRDFRLAQDADGVWKVRTAKIAKHHMTSPCGRTWKVHSGSDDPVALRIRPLGGGSPWDGVSTLTVLSATMLDSLAVRAEKGMRADLATGTSDYGSTLRFTVRNDGADENGSWAVAERTIPRPFLNLWADGKGGKGNGDAVPNESYAYTVPAGTPLAVGAWVKGDGSGAVVNFQFHSPADVNNARSEHHLTLDFMGWRYFVFSIWRDHRPEVSERYHWPYMKGTCYNLYERGLSCSKVEHVGLWVNGVGKGKTATVEISDLRVMAETKQSLVDAVVTIRGEHHPVPFSIRGDEYAELEDGVWTLYALGGEPLRRVAASTIPRLGAGENEVSFDCADAGARAQVIVTALGGKGPALNGEWTEVARRILSYEAEHPQFFAPNRNMTAMKPVTIRPDEKARISFTLIGPIVDPVVRIGEESKCFKRVLGVNDSLSAELEGVFKGQVPVSVETADANRTAAQLLVVKRYLR